MRIKVKNISAEYHLFIRYYYRFNDEVVNQIFESMDEFEEFMQECHPDVNYGELGTKFAKQLEILNKLAGRGAYEEKYYIRGIGCFISNGMLISCLSETGIKEKMEEYWKTSDKVNENYIHTYIAHQWQFNKLTTGILKVSYWYDRNKSGGTKFKIHQFKDKIVFENSDGTVNTIVVSDEHYVYYEGTKREEKK